MVLILEEHVEVVPLVDHVHNGALQFAVEADHLVLQVVHMDNLLTQLVLNEILQTRFCW